MTFQVTGAKMPERLFTDGKQRKHGPDYVFNSETSASSLIRWTPPTLTTWERFYKPLLKTSSFPLAETSSVYLM